MADTFADARKKLDDEFGQVRRHLDRVHEALDKVDQAGPEDDVYDLLGALEDAVKEARTGGLIGSGAKGHRKALERFRELKGEK